MTEKNGFDESDERLIEIVKGELSEAESRLAGTDRSDPKRKAELNSYITRCRQLLMDLKHLKAHAANSDASVDRANPDSLPKRR